MKQSLSALSAGQPHGAEASVDVLRAFFEDAPVGKCLTGANGLIILVNQAFAKLLGYEREELVGRRFTSITHPDDRPLGEAAYHRLLGEKEAGDACFDRRYLRADGTVVWTQVTSRLHRGDDGEPRYFLTHVEDISERREAARRVEDLATLLSTAEGLAHIGSWSHDLQNHSITRSEEIHRIFGTTAESFPPTFEGYLALVHAEDRDAVRDAYRRSREPQSPAFESRHRIRRQNDGETRHVYERCFHTRDDAGIITRSVGVVQDITEARQAEQRREVLERQLSQAQRLEAIGRLAGGIAHDFNNLLTVVVSAADLAQEDLSRSSQSYCCLDEILDASKRAAGLTRQLLAFGRKQILEPRPLDLNAVVRELRTMLARLLGEDIRICTDLSADLGLVNADPGQVEQVLMNLAVNARDAMPEGGTLHFETSNVSLATSATTLDPELEPGHYIRLVARDEGPGIPEEIRERIFEPFFTTKARGHGSGLGLATAYGIVKQSGGHIEVKDAPGGGALFEVLLPRARSKPQRRRQRVSEQVSPSGRETVLLVEDEGPLRQLLTRTLRRAGYTVLPAANAAEARRVAAAHPGQLHLLLSDVVLPGASGRELAAALTGLYPTLKVLFISGYADHALVGGLPEHDAPLLPKPFRPSTLLTALRNILDAEEDSGDAPDI